MDSFQLEMGQEKTWNKLNEEHFSVPACWDRLLSPDYGLFMGVSENSVPLNPMVNDHYPY